MQLHQEMRQTGDVEGLGGMRDLQPGRDAADPGDIHLDDRAGALLHILAEMRMEYMDSPTAIGVAVERVRRICPSRSSAGSGSSIQARSSSLSRLCPSDRLVDRKALVAVRHDLEAIAQRRAHGREAREVLGPVRLTDLHLRAGKSLLSGL